jgi:Na+/melibiose symporter-like transporter
VNELRSVDAGEIKKSDFSLWHNRAFVAMWAAKTTSLMGTEVTSLALPLIAVLLLNASTLDVGILRALATVTFLVVALPAGVLVDRAGKRRLLLWCDGIRMVVLLIIPLAALFGALSMPLLYAVVFVVGGISVLFSVAFDSFRTGLVSVARLGEANAKFAVTESFARVSGPGLGAVLVSWLGAGLAVFADALSYLASFVLLTTIGPNTEPPAREEDGRLGLWADARAGLAFLLSNTVLLRITVCTAIGNFSLLVYNAVTVVYMVRDLRFPPVLVGVLFCIGEIGGLIAGLLAPRLSRLLGSARIIWVSALCAPLGYLAVLAGPGTVLLTFGCFLFASSARYVTYDIAQYTYRQTICPPGMRGRMNASIRWVVGSAAPLGALLGGWMGTVIGPRATLAVATTVLLSGGLLLAISPLRRVRDFTELSSS